MGFNSSGQGSLFPRGGSEWQVLRASAGYAGSSRGIGLLDMLDAETGDGRASGSLGLHVLEIMVGLTASANAGGERMELRSEPSVPALVPLTAASVWQSGAGPRMPDEPSAAKH